MVMSNINISSAGGDKPNNNGNRVEAYLGADRMAEQKTAQQEAPSAQERVKKIRAEVKAAEQRAVDISSRISAMAEANSNPRLQEIKQQCDQLVANIRELNGFMVDALVDGEQDIEPLNKAAESLIKKSGNLYFEEQKAQADTLNKERQTRNMEFRAKIDEVPTQEPAAPTEQPAAEAQPQAEPVVAEQQAEVEPEAEGYDRAKFWSELKDKMGDRSKAEVPLQQVLKQLDKLTNELKQTRSSLEESDKSNETPQALIDQIVSLHLSLGGAERANEVRGTLEGWMKTQPGRNRFSSAFGVIEFDPIKKNIGKNGLAERVRKAQSEASKAGRIGSLIEKMKGLTGMSELRMLESRKRQQETALKVMMDTLISRIQNENKIVNLTSREATISEDKETLALQLGYDNELFGMIEAGENLGKNLEDITRRLKQSLARLEDSPAKTELANGFPVAVPEALAHYLSPQQIAEYTALAQQRQDLEQQLNSHIDATKALLDGGIAGATNRLLEQRAQQEAAALQAAADAEAQTLASAANADAAERARIDSDIDDDTKERLAQSAANEDEPKLSADDEDDNETINKRIQEEFKREKEELLSRWQSLTAIDLAEVVAEVFPGVYSGGDDYYTFVSQRLTKEGHKKISEINALQRRLEQAKTGVALNAVLQKKRKLLEAFKVYISDRNNLHAPITPIDDAPEATPNKAREDNKKITERAEINRTKKELELHNLQREDIEAYLPASDVEQIKKEDESNAFYKSLAAFVKKSHETFMDHTHRDLLEHSKAWDMLASLEDTANSKNDPMRMEQSDREKILKQSLEIYRAMQGEPFHLAANDSAATEINDMAALLRVDLAPLLAEQPKKAVAKSQPSNLTDTLPAKKNTKSSAGKTPRKLFRTPRRKAG